MRLASSKLSRVNKYALRQLVVLDNPLHRTTTASGLVSSAHERISWMALSVSLKECGVLRHMTGCPS